MAVIRRILKSTADASGRHQVVWMLSDNTASLGEFDASKDGGRYHQGRGVRAFTVERKEEDGRGNGDHSL